MCCGSGSPSGTRHRADTELPFRALTSEQERQTNMQLIASKMDRIRIKETHSAINTHKGPTLAVEEAVRREAPLEEVIFQIRLDNFRIKNECTPCILLPQKVPLKPH